jgi:Outer membrane protein beta-barrel domain
LALTFFNKDFIIKIMKKILTLAVLITMFYSNAQSSKREEGIKLGIKGGLNVSNFMGDIEDNAIRTSIHIGLVSEVIVNDNFSVQPELLYSGQGYTYDGSIPGYSRSKYNYILLPVLAKYYVAHNVSVEAGPQVGFLLSSKNKTSDANTKIGDQNPVDFSVDLGAGYELKTGVFFQLRYNLGLTNVNNASSSDALNYTNSVFQASIGILF